MARQSNPSRDSKLGRTAVVLLTLLGAGVIAVGAGLIVIYTGAYNVAATEPHLTPTRWVLDTTFRNSVAQRAEHLEQPPLDGGDVLGRGARGYAALCGPCHGVPGEDQPERSRHMRPAPPAFAEQDLPWSTREIFWIASNGVKMTGMPAFGPWQPEDKLWAIATLVERMPDLSVEEYGKLIQEPAAGQEAEQQASQSRPGTEQSADATSAARLVGDPAAGEESASQCRACHSVQEGEPAKVGPNLWNVVGEPIADNDQFDYSQALQALEGSWTIDRLDQWLTDPDAFAKGTKMTFQGFSDAQTRKNVIAYLQTLQPEDQVPEQ
jgi:cytochrome c2